LVGFALFIPSCAIERSEDGTIPINPDKGCGAAGRRHGGGVPILASFIKNRLILKSIPMTYDGESLSEVNILICLPE
jgi:hypothetical protein